MLRCEYQCNGSKVGDGLAKYIRLVPSVVADRIIAADGYGALAAFDRFTGKPIWQQQYAAVERTDLAAAPS